MAALWDPEDLLDIRGYARSPRGIQCHGLNGGYGSRCGWTKGLRDDERPDVRDAESCLRSMSLRPPASTTTTDLQRLARLCLCRDHHMTPPQIHRLARSWADIIRRAAAESHVQSNAAAPSPDSVASGSSWSTDSTTQIEWDLDSEPLRQGSSSPPGTLPTSPESTQRTDDVLAATRRELAALQIETRDLRAQRDRVAAEHDRELSEQSAALERTAQELTAAKQELARALAEQQKLRKEKDTELQEANDKLMEKLRKLVQKDRELQDADRELKHTSLELQERDRALQEAKRSLQAKSDELYGATRELEDKTRALQDRDREVRALLRKAEEEKESSGRVLAALAEAEDAIQQAQRELQRVTDDLRAASEEREREQRASAQRLQKREREMGDALREAREKYKRDLAAFERRDAEAAAARAENARLRAALDEAEARLLAWDHLSRTDGQGGVAAAGSRDAGAADAQEQRPGPDRFLLEAGPSRSPSRSWVRRVQEWLKRLGPRV